MQDKPDNSHIGSASDDNHCSHCTDNNNKTHSARDDNTFYEFRLRLNGPTLIALTVLPIAALVIIYFVNSLRSQPATPRLEIRVPPAEAIEQSTPEKRATPMPLLQKRASTNTSPKN